MTKGWRLPAGLILWLLSGAAMALDIVAAGLFRDRAVLLINGESHVLRVGESSPHGVRLLESDAARAVVEWRGQTQELSLSQRIGASFAEPEFAEVRLYRAGDGHYYANGRVNGRQARFLVDTGATLIAMSEVHARQLGLDYQRGQSSRTITASGTVESRVVRIPSVSVGDIVLSQVDATVIPGEYPHEILLGNSFLRHVEMSEANNTLVMRRRR